MRITRKRAIIGGVAILLVLGGLSAVASPSQPEATPSSAPAAVVATPSVSPSPTATVVAQDVPESPIPTPGLGDQLEAVLASGDCSAINSFWGALSNYDAVTEDQFDRLLTAAVKCTPSTEPTATPEASKQTYATVSSRRWQQILKAPDNYTGDGFLLWACVTQFDAATGQDAFRANASYKNLKGDFWIDGENAMFTGDSSQLADFVEDDIVYMKVTSLGSLSYDTQAGGNTTVPNFQVDKILHKGSCK